MNFSCIECDRNTQISEGKIRYAQELEGDIIVVCNTCSTSVPEDKYDAKRIISGERCDSKWFA